MLATQAACALTRPAIDAEKKVLVLSAFELDASFQMFYERLLRRRIRRIVLPNRRARNSFRPRSEKIARIVAKKKLAAGRISVRGQQKCKF